MKRPYASRPSYQFHIGGISRTTPSASRRASPSASGTYSNHIAFGGSITAQLAGRIRRRIEGRPGGTVCKTYLGLLYVADRL